MESDIRLMSEEEVRFCIDNIIDKINESLPMLKYDNYLISETYEHYWYYNDKLILELHDSDFIELLFDNDVLETEKITIKKLQNLIK